MTAGKQQNPHPENKTARCHPVHREPPCGWSGDSGQTPVSLDDVVVRARTPFEVEVAEARRLLGLLVEDRADPRD